MTRIAATVATGLIAVLLLSAVADGSATRHHRWHPHVRRARHFAEKRAGDVAFAVIDKRGQIRGFHRAGTAPTASVIKVMLLVSLLRMRHDSAISKLDRSLLGPMIRRSDNTAATRVRDMVGPRRIVRLARVARMRDFSYNPIWGLSRSSPRDQARFMFRLGTGLVDHQVALLTRRHRRIAIAVFTQFDPDHTYGKKTLRGVFARLLGGLPTGRTR